MEGGESVAGACGLSLAGCTATSANIFAVGWEGVLLVHRGGEEERGAPVTGKMLFCEGN
jgi:hypothetical protein